MSGMRADAMDVDSADMRGGLEYSGGRSRPGGARRSTGGRSTPYETRRGPPPPPGGGVDGQWSHDLHDLFESGSDIYKPHVARYDHQTGTYSAAPPAPPTTVNPSLRPFGTSTPDLFAIPAPAPVPAPATVATPPPAPTGSLASRINIKGIANSNAAAARPAAPAVSQRPTIVKPSPSEMREMKDAERKAKKEYDRDYLAWKEGSHAVEVYNLADGTTTDDVQTAFADFGAIEECLTRPGETVSGQRTLVAKLTFSKKSGADRAKDALDGALADGLKLKVIVKGSVGPRPSLETYLKAARAPFETSSGPAAAAAAAANLAQVQENSGKLRSDAIAQADFRSSFQAEPAQQLSYDEVKIREAKRPEKSLSQRLADTRAIPSVSARPEGTPRKGGLADRLGVAGGSGRNTRQGGGGALMDRMR